MYPPLRSRSRVLGIASLTVAAWTLGCEASLPTAADGIAQPGSQSPALMSARKAQIPTVQRCTPESPTLRLCLVDVNVKHGNEQGRINLKGIRNSNGNAGSASGARLTVSVLGTTEFDLSAIDLGSLRIGDATTTPITPVEELKKEYQASIVDLNGDRILDLMLHFSIQEMVDRGNLSEATTSLCLTGQGPGYIINGCGAAVAGNPDTGGGGNDGGGTTVTELIPFGTSPQATDDNKAVWVAWIKSWLTDPDDATWGYTGWVDIGIDVLEAAIGGNTIWADWKREITPFGTESPAATGFLVGCGLTASSYFWPISQQILIRRDVTLPAGSRSLIIEFLVDDVARVFVNGVEVTSGFETAQVGTCPSYSRVVTVRVPDTLLSADGNNRLSVWAADAYGYVNYFDMRVTARLPN